MSINEAVRSLGRLYCFSYLVSLIASSLVSWSYRQEWQLDNLIAVFADVSGASIGIVRVQT
jgi:hypothetical protein